MRLCERAHVARNHRATLFPQKPRLFSTDGVGYRATGAESACVRRAAAGNAMIYKSSVYNGVYDGAPYTLFRSAHDCGVMTNTHTHKHEHTKRTAGARTHKVHRYCQRAHNEAMMSPATATAGTVAALRMVTINNRANETNK